MDTFSLGEAKRPVFISDDLILAYVAVGSNNDDKATLTACSTFDFGRRPGGWEYSKLYNSCNVINKPG